MNDDITYFNNFQDLLMNLTKAFSQLKADDLRDLLFFLHEFSKENLIPDDIDIYVSNIPLESLEIQSKDKASAIFIGGVDKSIRLKYSSKKIPPIVIIKGCYRYLIIYGETFAIEAYLKNASIKAIVLDLEERDIFEVFNFNENTPVFLTPLIKENLEREKSK